MKTIALCLLAYILLPYVNAQPLQSRYPGVGSVQHNPALMAGSPYRFDINLVSLRFAASANQPIFDLNHFSKSGMKAEIFDRNSGPTDGQIQADLLGPSVMFQAGKTTIALSTRVRARASALQFDTKKINQLTEDYFRQQQLPYTWSSNQNMRLSFNSWAETGLSLSRVLYSSEHHQFKGGITLKYLAGIGNGYLRMGAFNGTVEYDRTDKELVLTEAQGRIATGFSGLGLSGLNVTDIFLRGNAGLENLRMKRKEGQRFSPGDNPGVGADLGFVYEYYKNGAGSEQEPHTLRLGVSLMDIGAIRYKKDMAQSGSYRIDISGSEQFPLYQLFGQSLEEYNRLFSAHPESFIPDRCHKKTSYWAYLPATLKWDADYRVSGRFFLNAGGEVNLMRSKNPARGLKGYSMVTLMPHYEGRAFAIALPVSYNPLSKLNAGVSMRMGPVFLGSSSFFTTVMSPSRQADAYVGARFGLVKRAPATPVISF